MIASKRIAAVLVALSVSGGKYWRVGSTEERGRLLSDPSVKNPTQLIAIIVKLDS